jgi:nicotinate-nucleotide--dimethylbenzimidazole phosphoribosyltransferase
VTDEELIARTIDEVTAPSKDAELRAWLRLESLTKPPGSLGRLEEIAARIATLRDEVRPGVARKAIVLMAADHGVTDENISPYPREVTAQMVATFAAGGAAINQLARHAGATLTLIDIGVATPIPASEGVIDARIADGTANMARGPAMTREQAARAVRIGIEAARALADDGVDLIGTGEMGIGNTTAAAAVTSVLAGVEPKRVVGPGTGLDEAGVRHKAFIVKRAIELNSPDPTDALDVLAKVASRSSRTGTSRGQRRWPRCGWRRGSRRGCSLRIAARSPDTRSCSRRSGSFPCSIWTCVSVKVPARRWRWASSTRHAS